MSGKRETADYGSLGIEWLRDTWPASEPTELDRAYFDEARSPGEFMLLRACYGTSVPGVHTLRRMREADRA